MMPFVYLDRPGQKGNNLSIPDGARVAVHLPERDCLELSVEPNGRWSLKVGPQLGGSRDPAADAVGFRTLASGQLLKFTETAL